MLADAYFGVALYVPPSFDVGTSWANLTQLQETGGGSKLFCYVSVFHSAGKPLQFAINNNWSGSTTWLSGVYDLPIGRWFTIVYHLRVGGNGLVEAWLDGQQISNWLQDFSNNSGVGPAFDAGVYEGVDAPVNYVHIDEMRCASTYELALPKV